MTRVGTVIAVLGLIAGVALGAIVGLGLARVAPWMLVLAGGFVAAAPFVFPIARQRLDVFEPIYLFAFAYAVLFVIRPAVDLATQGESPVIVGYSVGPTYSLALLAGLIGAVSFYVGYSLKGGTRLAEALPLPRAGAALGPVYLAVAITLIASLLLYGLFLREAGGLAAASTILNGRSAQEQAALRGSSGYFYAGLLWLTGPGVVLLALAKRWISLPGIAGFGLLLLAQVTPFSSGDRSWTVPALCSVALVWYLRRRRRPSVPALAGLMAIGFTLGVVVPAEYRNVEVRTGTLQDTVGTAFTRPMDGVVEFFQGLDTAEVDDLAVELRFVPGIVGYRLGSTYVEAFTRPIPRTLWPEKPREGDVQLMQVIWPEFARQHVGFAFSLFGEPFLNFGLPGIVLVSAIFGLAWRSLYTWFTRNPSNPIVLAVYALSWPFLFVYMRGGIGVDYQRQLIVLLPVVLIVLVAQRSIRQSPLVPSERLAVKQVGSDSEPFVAVGRSANA